MPPRCADFVRRERKRLAWRAAKRARSARRSAAALSDSWAQAGPLPQPDLRGALCLSHPVLKPDDWLSRDQQTMGEAGADVVGVDWRVPLGEVVRRVEPGNALQGNLDPALLFAPWDTIRERARDVLGRGRAAEGHIFNLGHGVLPGKHPEALARLADFVHTESMRAPA